jgi:hypothetical protein
MVVKRDGLKNARMVAVGVPLRRRRLVRTGMRDGNQGSKE